MTVRDGHTGTGGTYAGASGGGNSAGNGVGNSAGNGIGSGIGSGGAHPGGSTAPHPPQQRGRRRGDLEARPFPAVGAADDPASRREDLARLREWAEQEAEDAIDWYLRDKRLKRVGSRLLQGLAILFAVAGTAVPLGTAASGGSGQGWGYVLLAVAAGCKGFDHFFGLSATWMRDVSVAQALRAELNAVRLEWAGDVLRAAPPGVLGRRADDRLEPAEVERQLALITRLVTAVRGHMEAETADWRAEFSSSTRQLHEQGALPGAQR